MEHIGTKKTRQAAEALLAREAAWLTRNSLVGSVVKTEDGWVVQVVDRHEKVHCVPSLPALAPTLCGLGVSMAELQAHGQSPLRVTVKVNDVTCPLCMEVLHHGLAF